MTLVVKLPWPPADLHPNARVHWRPKAKVTKQARWDAKVLAMAAGFGNFRGDGEIPILFEFHPPDNRKRDRDGMNFSTKAYADGLADAMRVDDVRFVPTYRRAETTGGFVLVTVGET